MQRGHIATSANYEALAPRIAVALFAAVIFISYGPLMPARGQCDPPELAKLIASDAATTDLFGTWVAVTGDTVVVGSPLDDDTGSSSGSAYVFIRVDGVWTQQAKLTASDAAANDQFGSSVAVSGDTVVVGAMNDDDAGSSSGSAYVFVRADSVWTEQAKLTASDAAAGDLFGTSVAVSSDTALVGGPDNDDVGFSSGSAYVFVREGVVWTQQAKLANSDAASGDQFGASLALTGNAAVIGVPNDSNGGVNDPGSAYVFVRSGTVWNQLAKLTTSDPANSDQFGHSVAVSGDTVVGGSWFDDHTGGTNAGSAYVFVKPGGGWANMTETAKLIASDAAAGDQFGVSIALSGDTAIIGARFADQTGGGDAGAGYVFVREGGVWTEQTKLAASDAVAGDSFGISVALAGDTAIVGAYFDDHAAGNDAGSAYVFDLGPLLHPGDLDADGNVDLLDSDIFVEVLLGNDIDPMHAARADLDCSGLADGLDIQPFANALLN